MKWWEDNRNMLYGFIAAIVVLLVLFPSFTRGRPGIISFFRGKYVALEQTQMKNDKKIDQFYRALDRKPTAEEIARAARLNDDLAQNFLSLRNRMIFIPPMPYKISDYDVDPGHTLLTIQTRRREELQRILSLRDIQLVDPTFGVDLHGTSPQRDKLSMLLLKLAMVDDLTRRAADSRITILRSIKPQDEPFHTGPLSGGQFLKLYTVNMQFTGSYESIMKFLASLDGQYGQVTEVTPTQRRTEQGRSLTEYEIVIEAGSNHGITQQHEFTIFDDKPDPEDGLRYKGRAIVTDVEENRCKARVTFDRLPPVEEDELAEREIKPGDHATTNFYALLDLQIRSTPPSDKNSLANTVNASVTVAAVGLTDPTVEGVPETTGVRRMPPIRRGGY